MIWVSRFVGCVSLFLVCSGGAQAQPGGGPPDGFDLEALSQMPLVDGFIRQFNEQCAVCHGEDLFGATLGTPLVGIELRHGDSVPELVESIRDGFPETGMPGWKDVLSETEIYNLALYVAEQRQGTTIEDKRESIPLVLPEGTVQSELHGFRIEQVATGLDPLPFSIAPLPDGRILLSERMRGLRIVSPDGTLSDYVTGTPPVYDDSGMFFGQIAGFGWMLDVAPHPNYAENGWIYIHYTDRCSDCNEASRQSKRPVSMNKVIRGRIKDGTWVDQETIWEADIATYSSTSDLAAGGRLAFDGKGHLFFSVGIKDTHDYLGVQDLDLPYGKIHRVNDDGSIPDDNPFVGVAGALPSIWTFGHRSQQGLEVHPQTGDVWNTEMGPRGGDELNRLKAGGNYGWPLFTTGINYDGRPVNVADELGISLSPDEVEFPVLDMTPSPAISSFIFYQGTEFAEWNGHIIAGTLRATDLIRLEVADGAVVHREVLLEDLARFRDIELGPDGEVFVLLEHATDSQIVRLVPSD